MSVKHFVDYDNATAIVTAIGTKLKAINGAYVFKGSIAFASLPATPTEAMNGYVYNITNDFTTDARFIEGAGKKYSAGTNVAIADLSTYDAVSPAGSENPVSEGWYEFVGGKYVLSTDTTVDAGKTYYEKNVDVKFDVISTFVNVDALNGRIDDVEDMITTNVFDATQAYTAGDIVIHEDGLYRFKTGGHTAGDPWSASEVDAVDIISLITAAEPDSLTTAEENALIALLS